MSSTATQSSESVSSDITDLATTTEPSLIPLSSSATQNMESDKLAQLEKTKSRWKLLGRHGRSMKIDKLAPLFLTETERKR
eukprot:352366-Pyramimonas_sp.AAC.2